MTFGKLDDARPAARDPHDPTNRWRMARFEEPRHRHVRRNHEILDQLARATLSRHLEVDDLTARRHRTRFDRLEVERATRVSTLSQSARDIVLQAELRLEPANRGQLLRNRRRTTKPKTHR